MLQSLYEPDQILHLVLGEWSPIAISHQTDGDRVLIVEGATITDDVGTWQLIGPPIADMNIAISKPIAIPDNKVVSQPLIAILDMTTVD